jgi:integrase
MDAESTLNGNQERFESFVQEIRQRTPWAGTPWSAVQWRLPPAVVGNGARKQSVLHFTKRKAAASRESVGQPFDHPFDDFAKACVCYKSIYQPTMFSPYRQLIVAIQFLEGVMTRTGNARSPWSVTPEHFFLAERDITSTKWSQSYKWTISRSLQDVARIMSHIFFLNPPINFVATIKPPKFREGISDEAQAKSLARLPSDEVLQALADLFVSNTVKSERIILDVVGLCIATGMRIGEVLTLPEKCEVKESGRLGLRYWPEKGGEPVVKWIPLAAEPIVVRAVTELRELCSEAREMAQWLDQHPGQIKIDWDKLPALLKVSDLKKLLGHRDRGSPRLWTKQNGVSVANSGWRRPSYDPKLVINAVKQHRPKSLSNLEQYRDAASIDQAQLIAALGVGSCQGLFWIKRMGLMPTDPGGQGIWYRSADIRAALVRQRHQGPHRKTASGQSLFLGESLIVIFKNQLHPKHATSRYNVYPLPYSTVRFWLGESSREGSLFDRYGLKAKDGTRLRITTHQFRHWLNTLAANGGLSDVELARWMGRKDIKQNVHYIHGLVRRNVALAKKAVQEGTIAGPIADTYHRLEATDRESFLDGVINAVFLMPHGGCVHNFASRPCPKHFACLDGCSSYFRTLGDVGQREALKSLQINMEQSLVFARKQERKGAANWVAHLERKIVGIKQALSVDDHIEGDSRLGNIQVFPRGNDLSGTMP